MKYRNQVYVCTAGETFDSVALILFGEEAYAADLLSANPALCTKPVFTGGETLKIPDVEIPESDASGSYAPAIAPWK